MAVVTAPPADLGRGAQRHGFRVLAPLGWIPVGLVLVAAAALVLAKLAGLHHVVITGKSMGAYAPVGSLVFEEVVPRSALREGDVITFDPPPEYGSGRVTHRILSIETVAGQRVFRTQGDANPDPDPWRMTLDHGEQGRVVASVPWAGYPLGELADPDVRRILIGVPAALIALLALRRLWRDSGRDGPTT